MKKTLVALAALAATASFAQSSVTLYGTLDASYTSATTTAGTKAGQWDSAISSSVWGLRGSEDLGGGMSAIFNAETDVNTTNGSNSLGGNAAPTVSVAALNTSTAVTGGATDTMFRRAANVGIKAGFGEITLGRRMSLAILNAASMPVLGGNSVSTSNHATQGTSGTFFMKNAITYVSPTISGFTVGVQTGENGDGAVLTTTGSAYGTSAAMITYANGPLSAGIATQTVNDSAGANLLSYSNGRVSYALGALTLAAGSQSAKNAAGTTNTSNLYSAAYAVNPSLTVGGTYITNDTFGTFTNVQARYSLSKRTTLYGMASNSNANQGNAGFRNVWNGDAAATGTTATAYSLGVIHSF